MRASQSTSKSGRKAALTLFVNAHLHCYPQDQIKPKLRGDLVYALEVPQEPDAPIIRHIFGTNATNFPVLPVHGLLGLAREIGDAVVFLGVSKSAVYGVIEFDPPIRNRSADFAEYNRELVCASQKFFLTRASRYIQLADEAEFGRIGKLLSERSRKPSLASA